MRYGKESAALAAAFVAGVLFLPGVASPQCPGGPMGPPPPPSRFRPDPGPPVPAPIDPGPLTPTPNNPAPATPAPATAGPLTPSATAIPSASPQSRFLAATTAHLLAHPEPELWERWWMANRMRYLGEPEALPPASGDDDFFRGRLRPNRPVRMTRTGWPSRFDGHTAIPALRGALSHSSLYVRSAAALSLGKTGGPEAIDDLLPLLRTDPSPHVRALASLGIGFAGGPRAVTTLLETIEAARAGGGDAHVLAFAVLGLGLTKDAAATSALADALGSYDGEVRAAAARALGWLGHEAASAPLLEYLDREGGDSVARGYAAVALGRLGARGTLPILLEATRAYDVEVRRAATLALAEVADLREAPARLERLLQSDGNAAVRGYAAVGLGRTGGDRARETLRRTIERGRAQLRPWAAIGLGLLNREDPREDDRALLLRRFRKAREEREKAAFAIGLGLARSKEAADEITRFLREAQPAECRLFAFDALGLLGLQLLVPNMTEEIPLRPETALAAAFAMWARPLADMTVGARLLEIAKNRRRPDLAAPAAFAVGACGDPSTGRALLAVLADEEAHASVRAGAAFSLGTLAERGILPVLTTVRFGEDVAEDRRSSMRELRELP